MKKNSGLKILTVAAALVLMAGTVSAYVLLKPQRTWASAPRYIVDNSGSVPSTGVTAVISAVTGQWNSAGAGDVVDAEAGPVSDLRLGDGIPMMSFTDPIGVCTGNCLAATFTGYYSRRRGDVTIYDADIVTNSSYDWTWTGNGSCSGAFYLDGVQVHEVGHGLGLGHSNVPGATMYPSVTACDPGPVTLEEDDQIGLQDLYGLLAGDGGDGGGECTSPDLKDIGESCSSDSDCCSGKCRGKSGAKTCK